MNINMKKILVGTKEVVKGTIALAVGSTTLAAIEVAAPTKNTKINTGIGIVAGATTTCLTRAGLDKVDELISTTISD